MAAAAAAANGKSDVTADCQYINDYCRAKHRSVITCHWTHQKGRILRSERSFKQGEIIFREPPLHIVAEQENNPAFLRIKELCAQQPKVFEYEPLWYWAALSSLKSSLLPSNETRIKAIDERDVKRTKGGQLSSQQKDRMRRLDDLGFHWTSPETPAQSFEEAFKLLTDYKRQYGHLLVPRNFMSADGFRLGEWVQKQRAPVKQGSVQGSAEETERLESIGFIWNVAEFRWEEGFQHLETYRREHGNVLVPVSYAMASGFKLGRWVQLQRTNWQTLGPEKTRRLNALSFVWQARPTTTTSWDDALADLRAYKEEFGNVLVPQQFVMPNNFSLGTWVQRQRKAREALTAQQVQALDALGFVWNVHQDFFEEGLQHLADYKNNYRDTLVPQAYVANDGFKLGQWTARLRKRRNQLERRNPERIERLDKLGFVWDTDAFFEEGLQRLTAYKRQHGNVLVPRGYKTDDGFQLDDWVNSQRRLRKVRGRRFSANQSGQLDRLGFVWDEPELLSQAVQQ
eukprot:TRINITY_DN29485_c0_g2_i1.p1 TRINITY_DN29485_c0_g2~~TRINITY_DN29485_c0_g2_i1.p1  ORF type:complete len:533 (+),score=104.49 TRINITY_DN29485_c0_g2_i1:62-1600(+)